jgi:hypothetical protein
MAKPLTRRFVRFFVAARCFQTERSNLVERNCIINRHGHGVKLDKKERGDEGTTTRNAISNWYDIGMELT